MKFRGDKLRQARKDRGWSQTRLAARLNCHVTSVSDWERGDNQPSARHLASICSVLDKPVSFFTDEEEEASDVPVVSLGDLVDALRPLAALLERRREEVAA